MNNFEFIVNVKVDPSNKEAISALNALRDSVYGYEPLECIARLNLDTDEHYFGLLAFALCGDEAESWFIYDGFFVSNMDVNEETGEATLYTRQNWRCDDFLDEIVKHCKYDDIVIETYPNEECKSCVDEFGDYYYSVGKGLLYETALDQNEYKQ